jgi:hypothetical protein
VNPAKSPVYRALFVSPVIYRRVICPQAIMRKTRQLKNLATATFIA